MKLRTGISKILLSLVLCASFVSLTGCPQFDRDIDPDYVLFKPKEKKSGKNSGKDNPGGSKTTVKGAVLAIDKAVMASNEKLYASGTTASSSSKNILYKISPDAAKADDIASVAALESPIVLVKEFTNGELVVASAKRFTNLLLKLILLQKSRSLSLTVTIRFLR